MCFGQVPTTTPPSHQPHFVASDQRSSVFNIRKECDAACSRDFSTVCRLNEVAKKRSDRPKKPWDEVLVDDRKKLGMDSVDPQNRFEWRGRLRGRLVKQAQPSVVENRL